MMCKNIPRLWYGHSENEALDVTTVLDLCVTLGGLWTVRL